MTATVFFAVIFAALLHAFWNAGVKKEGNPDLAMVALVLGNIPIAIIALWIAPTPLPASWPYLGAGIVLQIGYQLSLLASYRTGELTQVYPIARGIAPLLVAGASVLFLDFQPGFIELTAIIVIGCGIISLSLTRQSDGVQNPKAVLLAVLTGCFIAAYSMTDGLGARLAGTALGFYGWIAIGNAIAFPLIMEARQPGLIRQIPKHGKQMFLVGGTASFVAYAIVVWAFTQAPIPLVTALRETSIVFALLLGVFLLKEKLNLAKLLSIMTTLLGAALLRLSRP